MNLSIDALLKLDPPSQLINCLQMGFDAGQDFDYQAALDLLDVNEQPTLARWLIKHVPINEFSMLDIGPEVEDIPRNGHVFAPGDITIHGDLVTDGDLICGGQIFATSNLSARSIDAGGSIHVANTLDVSDDVVSEGKIAIGEDLHARDVSAGFAIDVHGMIHARKITAGLKAQSYVDALSCIYDFDHPQAESIQRAVETLLTANCGYNSPFDLVQSKLDPFGIRAKNGLQVQNILSQGAIWCGGAIFVAESIDTQKSIQAGGKVRVMGKVAAPLGLQSNLVIPAEIDWKADWLHGTDKSFQYPTARRCIEKGLALRRLYRLNRNSGFVSFEFKAIEDLFADAFEIVWVRSQSIWGMGVQYVVSQAINALKAGDYRVDHFSRGVLSISGGKNLTLTDVNRASGIVRYDLSALDNFIFCADQSNIGSCCITVELFLGRVGQE